MKRPILLSILLTIAIALSGCAYMNVKTPLDTDLDKTTLGTKTGTASVESVLWVAAWGDAGIKAAAENGKISVVNHVDQQTFSVCFGLYTKVTTIVYGD